MKKFSAAHILAALLLLLSLPAPLMAEDTAVALPDTASLNAGAEEKLSIPDSAATPLPEPEKVDDRDITRAFSDSLKQQGGFPVVVNSNEIIRLYSRLRDIDAEQRAVKTSRLLTEFFRSSEPVDSLRIVEGKTLTAIRSSNNIIAAFTDEDAEALGTSRMRLADSVLTRISNQAEKFREETSGRNILLSILKALALLLTLAVVWHYLNSFFTLIDGWIQKIRLHNSTSSQNKLVQLLSPDHLASGFGWFSRITELFLKILLIYAYLTTVFSFFPWTQDLSTNLLAFVLEPAKRLFGELVTMIPNIIAFIILVALVRYLGRVSDIVFRNIGKGELKFVGFEAEWAEPTRKMVKIVLYALVAFLLLSSMPLVNNRAALTIIVILGLTFSLSAAPGVQNIVSGIMLNYTGSFRVGDRVRLDDISGEIVYKGLLVTRLRTLRNEIVVIPNKSVFRSKILNYTESVQKNGHISLQVQFNLERNIEMEGIRDKVIQAALGTDGIMLDPKPVFYRTDAANGRYGYLLRANTGDIENLEALYSRLMQNVEDTLRKNNIM